MTTATYRPMVQPVDNNGDILFPQYIGEVLTKTVTYTNGENDNGDFDGSGTPEILFTVTGSVAVRVWGECSTDLVSSGGTIEVGISGNTAALIVQTTASDIDANEIWNNETPESVKSLDGYKQLMAGSNIIASVATADISAGVIKYYCSFVALSSDGAVVVA